MGRKITLFRFDVDAGDDADRRTEEERVTVERPTEIADERREDDGGGSLLRRLLVGGLLLAAGLVGGFVLRGTAAGRDIARRGKSAVPFVGGDSAAEPTPAGRTDGTPADRGTASLVGFGFLVSLTALSKRLYGTGPTDRN